MAQEAIRLAMMTAYSLYIVKCKLMGHQLRISAGSPPLWMSVTVECFHEEGTLELMRQML